MRIANLFLSSALLAFLSASCAGPPPSAYIGGTAGASGAGIGLGKNDAGEPCTQQAIGDGADVFCGTWDQPSGHIEVENQTVGAGNVADRLREAATISPWRNGLDSRFVCHDPVQTTIAGGAPAMLLSCTRKLGGWPQVALVASVDGKIYLADGILPALPVLERAIGVLSGRVPVHAAPGLPPGQTDGLMAARLAAQSFSAGDIGQFQVLMRSGTRANLAESFVAAEGAYRAALALQRKALGKDDPNTSVPQMLMALQLSDQGRTAEADQAFARAEELAGKASDPTVQPRLRHYRALNALNEGKPEEALPLLEAAEAGYAALLPADVLHATPRFTAGSLVTNRRRGGGTSAGGGPLLLVPDQRTALLGVIETRRYRAIVLRELGRPADAQRAVESAKRLALGNGLTQKDLAARLSRTGALVDDLGKSGSGYGEMQSALRDFALGQPGTRPLAQTYLLRAAQEMQAGSSRNAIALCRTGATLLRDLKAGTGPTLIAPCLAAFAAEADKAPASHAALMAEMFEESQLVQGGITVRQIALASARVSEAARNPQVGQAIRRQQDASLAVAALQRQSDTDAGPTRQDAADLSKRIDTARAALADADAALQAAAPNYGQLVQEVVPAASVLASLSPGEAFVSLALTPTSGWVFVLRDGNVRAVPTKGGSVVLDGLVKRIRKSIESTGTEPPPFDIDAAQTIYADTLGQADALLKGVESLTIVPSGALLSIPFELLLTGPADQNALADAPWLVRRMAITHVPAAANFVTLRKAATVARASQPWYGFGDFQPVTLAQAEHTFPAGVCENSARLFAGLPPLPFARRELDAARQLLGGASDDALEGAAFTTPNVLRQDLRNVRVLHFATHALLPSDLRCQSEPAIVTSTPSSALDASGALLTSSDVATLRLDADVVVLSACNSGGPNGATSGESLSGLARAFFYAGARALMVTHWSINDQTTAFLVAETMQRLRAGDRLGIAGALRGAQLAMLDEAGKTLPADLAHPFYWAPFALVGEGKGRTVLEQSPSGQSGKGSP